MLQTHGVNSVFVLCVYIKINHSTLQIDQFRVLARLDSVSRDLLYVNIAREFNSSETSGMTRDWLRLQK